MYIYTVYTQGDKNVSVHTMITIRKVTRNVQSVPASLQTFIDTPKCTRPTPTPSVIPNSNYVIMVSDWNCIKYFTFFLFCNHQVHKECLITLYMCVCVCVCVSPMRNFRLALCCEMYLCSSAILCSLDWLFITDVSIRPTVSTFKVQAFKGHLHGRTAWTLKTRRISCIETSVISTHLR
jgi:hypothetical protein